MKLVIPESDYLYPIDSLSSLFLVKLQFSIIPELQIMYWSFN